MKAATRVIFSGTSQVNVRNLVAAAANITDEQFTQRGIYVDANGTQPTFTDAAGFAKVATLAEIGANAANLSPRFLTHLKTLYAGTRLEAQEIEGLIVTLREGARRSVTDMRQSGALVEQVRATRARGGRVIAVGTTVVRALESATRRTEAGDGELQPFAGETQIFIFPGYRIRSVDAMVTNFHLPESTLLMLVSAFAGKDRIMAAYAHAVREQYRFFSYGDAMLLFPEEAK